MKLIEAMKKVKMNKEKIADLQKKIQKCCSNLSMETPEYGDATKDKIDEWLQSCNQLSLDNVKLLCNIQRTNLATKVTVEFTDGSIVEKTIAEWVWRRREYAKLDKQTWQQLTDRNLKEGMIGTSTGTPIEAKIIRHWVPETRDKKLAMYGEEPGLIDSKLEVVNAVTDLIEV
jgi:hypothetical protein